MGDSSTTVLVIDNDATLLGLLERSLAGAGHQVVTAADGREGSKAIYGVRPDPVVLDVMMPRLSGWDVLAGVRDMTDRLLEALAEEPTRLRLRAGGRRGRGDAPADRWHPRLGE